MAIDGPTIRELKVLDEASGGGLLEELIALFRTGTPERIARSRDAVARSDAHALAGEAHALKGGAGALGAVSLVALAGKLETLARAGDLMPAGAMLDSIEGDFHIVLGELERERTRA